MTSIRALAVLAVAGLALPAAAVAQTKTKTLPTTKVKITKIDLADVGPAGDSPGDMQLFAFTTSSSQGAGSGHGYCIRTEVGVAADCTAIASFRNGTIATTWEARDGRLKNPLHVTGGSGAYFAARGAGTITQDSAADLLDYTITLKIRQ